MRLDALMTERVREVLGRLFANRGWDRSECRDWTRYLVVRPLVLSRPSSFGLVVGLIAALTVSDKDWIAYLAALVGGVLGLTLGGWYWLRREAEQTRDARKAPAGFGRD